MSDLIERQAVLDGIEELKRSPWASDHRGFGFEYLITEALDVVADLCVKQAPSVNPVPCDNAISRQAVLETLDDMDNVLDEDRTIENYKELLKECYKVLPPVNPQAPKTGWWVDVKGYEGLLCKCSNCCKDNERYKHRTCTYKTNFCPDCGARMIEPQEG